MRQLSIRSSPSWNDAEQFVRSEIDNQWYGTDLGEPYTSFITRDRLSTIWQTPLPHHRNQTPFTVLLRCSTTKLTFEDFCETLIQLISALVYVQWNRIFKGDTNCEIRVNRDHRYGLGVRRGSGHRWCDLSNADIPLTDRDIQLLFSNGPGNRVAFRDSQFQFKPLVIIAGTQRPGEYPPGTRLPFESVKALEGRKGWYGDVDAVRIVEGHIEWESSTSRFGQVRFSTANEVFACKTFRVRENFFQEHDRLVTIGSNSMRHDHIMIHVAAVVVGPQFKILFPWAWADLNHFFCSTPAEYPEWLQQDETSPFNLLRESIYLGGALAFLHDELSSWEYGRRPLFHMDLKPDNILVVLPPSGSELEKHPLGLWKIADFGLSDFGKFRSDRENQPTSMGDVVKSIQSSGSRPVRQPGPFQAPEAERPSPQGIDQAKADVWSFGCVLAEILAFSALGCHGVRSLRKALHRNEPDPHRSGYFYTCTKEGSFELVTGLDGLLDIHDEANQSAQTWFSSMWQFIKKTALSTNPQDRPGVKNLCDDLRHRVIASGTPRDSVFIQVHVSNETDQSSLGTPRQGIGHLSEPTARFQHTYTVPRPSRSLSGPPQPLVTSPSRAETRARLSIRSNNSSIGMKPVISKPGSYVLTGSGGERYSIPSTRGRGSRALDTTITTTSNRSPNSTGGNLTPASPRQSGSLSSVGSPLALQPSSIFAPDLPRTLSMDLTRQLKTFKLEHGFVVLPPDGTSILFSNGRQVAWSALSPHFVSRSLMMHDLQIKHPVGLDSVHLTTTSALVKVDKKHAILLGDANETSANSAQELDHLTRNREIRKICMSSAQYVAIEFPDTIEIFDLAGMLFLQHPKDRRDLILDLTFSPNAEHLIAISSDRYLVWRLDRLSNLYVLTPNNNPSFRGLISPDQTPKIIALNGSPNFLVQDPDSLNRNKNIVIVDESGPWVQKLPSVEGSIISPVCMTLDNRELFAMVSKSITRGLRHNSTYTLQRWAVSQGREISIEAAPPTTRIELSISRSSFSGPGKLSIAPARLDGQNYAVVAQHDGRVFRTGLAASFS